MTCPTPHHAAPLCRQKCNQGGVATLAMVMILFFVMAMVAAYTNRNLLYEQRMSINNFRASAALTAADAGIDWTIAMLNGTRVDSNCAAPAAGVAAAASDDDFRNRYTIWKDDGSYDVPKNGNLFYRPTCLMSGVAWTCKCPSAASPDSTLNYPASSTSIFFVEVDKGSGPGLLKVDARGSYESSLAMSFNVFGNYSRVSSTLALARALPVPPVAALTVGRSVSMTAAGIELKVGNPDPSTGVTVHAGSGLDANAVGNLVEVGPAGSSTNTSIGSDADLLAVSNAAPPVPPALGVDFFQSMFGMDSTTYKRQPASAYVDCAAGCNSASIATVVANNPGRIIWIDGDLDLTDAATLGTVARPLMLLASRDITLSTAVTLNGFVYAGRDVQWSAGAAGSTVRGAMVAARDFVGASPVAISYDADMLRRISLGYGSFVRLPGSWHVVPTR